MAKRLLIVILTLMVSPALSAPDSELWSRWVGHDPAAKTIVDHSAWTAFLSRYRTLEDDGIARVSYAAVTSDDRAALTAYVDHLASTPVSALNRAEQRPFWINLYNALTVKAVLDAYPVDSILDIDISPGIFSDGPWGASLVTVESEPLTLDDIEHRILRPIWHDPRIHYVVNCASLGCPNLPAEAMTAANAEVMLDGAARAFINHPRAVTIDGDDDLIVSSIYDWYAIDFGSDDEAIIAHLLRFAEPDLAAQLTGRSEIDDNVYDWRLNDAG